MAKIIIAMLCFAICARLAYMGFPLISGLFMMAGIFSLMASADSPLWRQ